MRGSGVFIDIDSSAFIDMVLPNVMCRNFTFPFRTFSLCLLFLKELFHSMLTVSCIVVY